MEDHLSTLYGRIMQRLHALRPALHIIHRRDPSNAGDMMSSCANYYDFSVLNYKIVLHDIYKPKWKMIVRDDPIVLSGGGLLNCLDEWNRNINKCLLLSTNVIGWGIGFNLHHGTKVKIPLDIHKFRLLGVRDATPPCHAQHVPCSVCKHPLLPHLVDVTPVRQLGVCEHIHHPIPIPGDAKITNGAKQKDLVRFLAESRCVLTNSYHSVVLCHLLGRAVVLYGGFSQKFDTLSRPVTRFSGHIERDMEAAIKLAESAPPSLEESCRINDAFYDKVAECICNPRKILEH